MSRIGTSRLRTALCLAASSFVLISCGGGGGGGGGTTAPATNITTAPPPPPPAPTGAPSTPVAPTLTAAQFRTAEYNRNYALEAVRAADAYARGYNGQGVIIGMVDFNFNLSSSEVVFNPASRGPDQVFVQQYNTQFPNDPATTEPHGHAVAVMAAGVKNDAATHGLAYGSTVLAVDFFSGVNRTTFNQGGRTYHVSDPWTYLTSNGARIINISLGYDEDEASTPISGGATQVYGMADTYIAIRNGALLVSSAGNNGHDDPMLSNLDIIADINRHGLTNGPGAFIIAGGVDRTNNTRYDKAGTARDYYMVAPAVQVVGPYTGTGLFNLSGTSFAAPLISAGAAIVLSRWPTLTMRQVRDILFASATDLGAPGVDSVYGHGLLNVDAALQPNGVTTLATSTGAAQPLSSSGMVLAAAFGDAGGFRDRLPETVIFDSFGRDFSTSLAGRVTTRQARAVLNDAADQRLGWRTADIGPFTVLGAATRFSYRRHENPREDIVASQLSGPQKERDIDTVMRFSGVGEGYSWTAGTGLSLTEALESPIEARKFRYVSLTQPFALSLDAPGAVGAVRVALSEDTGIAFGAGTAGYAPDENNPIPAMRHAPEARNFAVRIDTRDGQTVYSLSFGGLLEQGTVLGSLSSGGLSLAESATTAWAKFGLQTPVGDGWALQTSLLFSATRTDAAPGSLITGFGPIYASSASFGLAKEEVFSSGDLLAFTVAQPLRVESATLRMQTGARADAYGTVAMSETTAQLSPSGREIAVEAYYRMPLQGGWSSEANLSYAYQSSHLKEDGGLAGMLWLTRPF